MKQVVENFIDSLRGKVSAEGEQILDLLSILIDDEYDKRKREKQEIGIDTPFSEYKIVEAFGTKMAVPSMMNHAAIDCDGRVWLYPDTPFLVEGTEAAFAFFGNSAMQIGTAKNQDVLKTKEPCELCVELKEIHE